METHNLNRAEKLDTPEEKTVRDMQIARLQRLCAVNAAMAQALAPLVFTVAVRS